MQMRVLAVFSLETKRQYVCVTAKYLLLQHTYERVCEKTALRCLRFPVTNICEDSGADIDPGEHGPAGGHVKYYRLSTIGARRVAIERLENGLRDSKRIASAIVAELKSDMADLTESRPAVCS